MSKFTRNSLLVEVLQKCPGAVDIFTRYGLNCCECMGADIETIGDIPLMHPELDLEVLLQELNSSCSGE